jgi:hypothetical protein
MESYNGSNYFIIFIDDFLITTWIYLLKNKSEVFSHFQNFTHMVETQFNKRVLRMDNGTKYINKNILNFLN